MLDLDNLAESLKDVDKSDMVIACPTVLRNQIIWRHPEAPIMGKWTETPEQFPETYRVYPDYCNGNIFTLTPATGLVLAAVARTTPVYGLVDTYVTG